MGVKATRCVPTTSVLLSSLLQTAGAVTLARLRSLWTVLIRAMSRRCFVSSVGASNRSVCDCIRSLNRICVHSLSDSCSCSSLISRNSFAFIFFVTSAANHGFNQCYQYRCYQYRCRNLKIARSVAVAQNELAAAFCEPIEQSTNAPDLP